MADYSQFIRENPNLIASVQGRMGQENPFPEVNAQPAPQPAPQPMQPQVAPVDAIAPTRSAGASNREVANTINERIGLANEAGQSHLREGEAKAQGAQRMADESAASAGRANAFHQEAVNVVRNNRELQDQYRKQSEADLAKASEEPHGMAKFAPMILGIVGAAAMAGGDQGLGQGLGAIGQLIGQQSREKAARAATQFDGHQSLAKNAMHDSQNELDAATKLMAQEHEVTARQLERIGQESAIPAYREQAMRLAQATRDQGLQLRQNYYSTMAAQQLAASKTGRKELTLAELQAKDQAGIITPSEKATLLGLQEKANGIDLKRSEDARQNEELELKRAGGAGGPKLSADQEKMISVVAGAKPAYERIQKLVGSKKAEDVDVPRFGVGGISSYVPDVYVPESHIQHRSDEEALLNTVLRAESGGAIGKEEIAAKRRGYGLDSSDETVRARGLQALLKQVEGLDYKGQLKPQALTTLRPKAK